MQNWLPPIHLFKSPNRRFFFSYGYVGWTKKLASWKRKLLSIGGHATLIKASLSSLPIYYMSLFSFPKGVLKKLVKIQRQFMWNGSVDKHSLPLAPWKLLELPKSLRGLSMAIFFTGIWHSYLCESRGYWMIPVRCGDVLSMQNISMGRLAYPPKWGPLEDHLCCHHETSPYSKHSTIKCEKKACLNVLFWHELWAGSIL